MKTTTLISIILIGLYFIAIGFNYIPQDLIFSLFLIFVGIAGGIYSIGREESLTSFHITYRAANLFWSLVIIETGISLILLNLKVPPLSVLGLYIVFIAITYYFIRNILKK